MPRAFVAGALFQPFERAAGEQVDGVERQRPERPVEPRLVPPGDGDAALPGGEALGLPRLVPLSGRHLNFTLRGEGRTPDYRADLGFTTQTDTNRWSADVPYDSEPRPAAPLLLSWSLANTTLHSGTGTAA